MQVTPVPVPVLPSLPTQDVVAKTLPAIQAQAATPVTQRAVDPSHRSDRGNKTRSNNDRAKGGDRGNSDSGKSGSTVNIRV